MALPGSGHISGSVQRTPMELQSVSYIGMLDRSKDTLYKLCYEDLDTDALISNVTTASDSISIFQDRMLLVYRNDEIFVVLLASKAANEVFVKDAFDALVETLDKVIKRWNVERIAEKYDQVVLIMNEFVFQGVILADNAKELGSRVMKRTFESLQGIKMKKGLASFLNKATKSLRNH